MSVTKNTFVGNLKTIGVLVAIMWLVLVFSYLIPINNLGIRPRHMSGLAGIPFAPFLHGGFPHLIGNSISLLILGTILLSIEGRRSVLILTSVGLLSGAGTWLIGNGNSIHIGASGLVYGMIGYLLFYGIFKRSIGAIAVSILVFLLYGGAIWGLFPSGSFISWEMHLCGFLSGILLAKMLIKKNARSVEDVPA